MTLLGRCVSAELTEVVETAAGMSAAAITRRLASDFRPVRALSAAARNGDCHVFRV